MCTVVVEYLETGSGETEKLASLESKKVSQENVRTIFSGMHSLLSVALKQSSLKTEVCHVTIHWVSCDHVSIFRYSKKTCSRLSEFIVGEMSNHCASVVSIGCHRTLLLTSALYYPLQSRFNT